MAELKLLGHELHAAYVPHFGTDQPMPVPDFSDAVRKRRVFLNREGTIRGFVLCYPDGGALNIDALGVDHKFLHTDLPHQLLSFAEGHGFEAGCHSVAIPDTPEMAAAIDHFRRQGFEEIGRTPLNGHDRVELKVTAKPGH